jgi:hypothetical protein
MRKRVTGVKSVDFKITATGYGVVNWNGSTALSGDGKEINNHTLPKLRGYTNLNGKVKEENGYQYKKDPRDIDFTKNPMYISQNCVKHGLFKDHAYELGDLGQKDLSAVLASLVGLVRGYVVASSQCKRTSPLLIEDLVDQLGNGNYEQFTSSSMDEVVDQAGNSSFTRSSTSLFSKTTFGDTSYVGYGSISIENLQFISLDSKFDRRAMIIDSQKAPALAADITAFLQSISHSAALNPVATFHPAYARTGTIFNDTECGILLNDDAVEILVDYILDEIANLEIVQGRGYMVVRGITVDYNTGKMMRIKYDSSSISEVRTEPYAEYFTAVV